MPEIVESLFLAQLAHHLRLYVVELCAFTRSAERRSSIEPRSRLNSGGAAAGKMKILICRGGRSRWRRLTRWFARQYRIDPGLLSAHARRVGCAKSVAVELAAQLADPSGRAVDEHYGMCANAVVANHHRLAARPEVLQAIENLSQKLRKRRSK